MGAFSLPSQGVRVADGWGESIAQIASTAPIRLALLRLGIGSRFAWQPGSNPRLRSGQGIPLASNPQCVDILRL